MTLSLDPLPCSRVVLHGSNRFSDRHLSTTNDDLAIVLGVLNKDP